MAPSQPCAHTAPGQLRSRCAELTALPTRATLAPPLSLPVPSPPAWNICPFWHLPHDFPWGQKRSQQGQGSFVGVILNKSPPALVYANAVTLEEGAGLQGTNYRTRGGGAGAESGIKDLGFSPSARSPQGRGWEPTPLPHALHLALPAVPSTRREGTGAAFLSPGRATDPPPPARWAPSSERAASRVGLGLAPGVCANSGAGPRGGRRGGLGTCPHDVPSRSPFLPPSGPLSQGKAQAPRRCMQSSDLRAWVAPAQPEGRAHPPQRPLQSPPLNR